MKNIQTVNILNHTHWDREWYETFEEFRFRLRNGLRYTQELLNEGKIDNFFLDGQTIVLDDYKEIVSDEEYARLLTFIQKGKIEVGPWYLLADEFLVSGESMIKNLEIGTNTAKKLGSPYNIGYLPDTFGHISQMPQILQNYGIDSALIFRGAISDRFENTWEGADGTKVFTIVLPLFEGYYQTFLKSKDFVEKTKTYLEGNAPYLTSGNAMIMNGADHTFTSSDVNERVKQLSEKMPDIDFKQTLMSEYVNLFAGIEPDASISGEQRDPSKIFILPGVYSTRSYLKNQNQMCEDQAVGIMEALNVWTNGRSDSAKFMEYVWKLILQNQPHDSICGCSVDAVHDEMETRTQKVLSAISRFSKDTLHDEFPFEYLDDSIDNDYLYVVNNTPIASRYPVTATIRIPAPLDKGSIKLFHNEEEISFDVLKRERREEFIHHILAEPHYGDYVIYDIRFSLPFEGAEIKALRIDTVKNESEVVESRELPFIQNDFYKIEWNEDSLSITDLETGVTHDNQHHFTSSLDTGDTYNYSPPLKDKTSKAIITGVSDILKGETFQSVTVNYEMRLPASLNEDRSGPSEAKTTNKMKTTITLHKGKRFIYFKTKVNNTAKDQKLKVGFSTSKADISYADTAFDLLKRETLRDKKYDMPKNKEAVMNQYPTQSTVIANEHQLLHRGLQEYEIDAFEGNDHIFLSVIRSVGWLSRRDLRTRGNGAGPGFETPGAQCIGEYEFEYGLVLGRNNMSLNNGKFLRQNVLTQQSHVKKEDQKLFKLSSAEVAFSSFMLKEENTFDIRLFNPSLEDVNTDLILGFDPEELYEVDFTGNILSSISAAKQTTISFGPKQIKTIRVKRKGR
ncbi:hypothetical protein ABE65_018545 [Fictibacillus phosphorivorans]|uniref:Glycoside hydrolase family 38 central domain-containing protein n=1 Tax=Fictibacillus phosphorivorans TaxID=1221500 RepID=A0A160IR14_9BACL|nr:glycoside hydrolase family 38 C-terminal domain-containing protein [Fictibacillus phosphorivorans]ANC78687.1 hypothetical protein ABE65_018545 [Fictibacillus phosphorivorans]